MADVADGSDVQRTAVRARSLTGAGLCCSGLNGGGEVEWTAVEDVHAALPGDEGGKRGERVPFAGQDQDVGGGTLAGPVPGGQPDGLAAAARQPVIEQAERDADAGSDGRTGVGG